MSEAPRTTSPSSSRPHSSCIRGKNRGAEGEKGATPRALITSPYRPWDGRVIHLPTSPSSALSSPSTPARSADERQLLHKSGPRSPIARDSRPAVAGRLLISPDYCELLAGVLVARLRSGRVLPREGLAVWPDSRARLTGELHYCGHRIGVCIIAAGLVKSDCPSNQNPITARV